MVNSVKGLAEVKIDDISVGALSQNTQDVVDVVKELCQTVTATSKSMLFRIQEVVVLQEVRDFCSHHPLKYRDDMRGK